MTGHQPLNELPANKRPSVRMVEELVMNEVQFLARQSLISWIVKVQRRVRRLWIKWHPAQRWQPGQHFVVQQELGPRVMPTWHLSHLPEPVFGRTQSRAERSIITVIPASHQVRQSHDLTLRVSRHHLIFRIQNQRAVRPHAEEANRKQLLDFSRVVLIRNTSGADIRLVVLLHVQIPAHRRGQRDLLQQGAEVAKGMGLQQIIIVS